jgi:hypothetical protein
MGQAASAAAVLALSGAKGKRFALPRARILLHQPHGAAEGQAVDIEIQAKEIVRNRELMNEIIAEHTGQPMESVSKDTDRDYILIAERAVEYGAVDEIITSLIRPELAVAVAGVLQPNPPGTHPRAAISRYLVGRETDYVQLGCRNPRARGRSRVNVLALP